MARAFCADVLEDLAGNKIVGALGTLYTDEAATTLATDAYAAASGGSPVTTVTTDAGGRWSAFFTTPKEFWVKWSTNGGTAHQAGASPRSFTEFVSTRKQAFEPPSDEATDDAAFAAHLADTSDAHGITAITHALPATTVNARYCAPWGDNTLDGLSPGTALASVLAAYDALPSTGGTVYVYDNTPIGGAVAGQGIWLYRNTYGGGVTIPAGWRVQKQVTFEGIGGAPNSPSQFEGGKSRITGATSVGIWLAGTDLGITFRNIELAGYIPEPIVVNRAPDGTAPATSNTETSSFTFERVKAQVAGAASRRNAVKIEGNANCRVFWFFIRDCSFQGNVSGTTFQERAAMYITFAYSCDIRRNLMFFGGMYWVPSNSTSDATIDWLYSESTNSGDPTLQINPGGTSPGSFINVDHISRVDPVGSGYVVEIINTTSVFVRVGSVMNAGSALGDVSGPHLRLGLGVNGLEPTSLYRQGGVGFSNTRRYVEAEHDAARRLFGAVAVPATNLAITAPGSWGVRSHGNYHTGGNATVTIGKRAPNGTNDAAELSYGVAGQYGVREFYNAAQTLAVGDHIVWGAWVRSTVATSAGDPQYGIYLLTAGFAASTSFATPDDVQKQWRFVKNILTITAIGTNPCTINFSLEAYNGEPLEVWNPMLLLLPAATFSDEEAFRVYQHLSVWPNAAAAGSVYLPGTAPLVVGGNVTAPIFVGASRSLIGAFTRADFPGNGTDTAIALNGITSTATFVAIRAGSITGLSMQVSEARTTGSVTATVQKNGVNVALTADIDGTNTLKNQATAAFGTITYVAGDMIGVVYHTAGPFAPTGTNDLSVFVEVNE